MNQDDVFRVMEGLIFFKIWKEVLGVGLLRLARQDAFRRCPKSRWATTATTSPTSASRYRTDVTGLVVDHKGGGVLPPGNPSPKFANGTYRRDLPTPRS
ncbi:MAG: hypothetical protein U0235_08400 [Polyangiaceae bacterium]